MWIIKRIDEADFGCEERMPGEPLLLRVTLEDDNYNIRCFDVPENWLELQELDEGDEWPEDIETEGENDQAILQAEWYEKYLKALEELK